MEWGRDVCPETPRKSEKRKAENGETLFVEVKIYVRIKARKYEGRRKSSLNHPTFSSIPKQIHSVKPQITV